MYLNIEGGKKIAMPRYYKNKIYNEVLRKIIGEAAKKKNEEEEKLTEEAMIKKHGDRWPLVKKENIEFKFKKMAQDAEKGRNKL